MKALVGLALLLTATGCDNGGVVDEAIQQGVRQNAVQACIAWLPQTEIAAAVGLDEDRLCTCAANRIIEGANVAHLNSFQPDSPENRAAIIQCVTEVKRRDLSAQAE